MRVLVAPDCYGDSLSAVEAAAAIATGWTRSRPGDSFIVAPQSDGGPGFVEVLASRIGGSQVRRVWGPLDFEVDAHWVFDARTATAYLECAQACGLALLGGPPTPLDRGSRPQQGCRSADRGGAAGRRRSDCGRAGWQCVYRRR